MTLYLLFDVTQSPPVRRVCSPYFDVIENVANRQLRTRYGDCDELTSDGWSFTHPRSGNDVDYVIVRQIEDEWEWTDAYGQQR